MSKYKATITFEFYPEDFGYEPTKAGAEQLGRDRLYWALPDLTGPDTLNSQVTIEELPKPHIS